MQNNFKIEQELIALKDPRVDFMYSNRITNAFRGLCLYLKNPPATGDFTETTVENPCGRDEDNNFIPSTKRKCYLVFVDLQSPRDNLTPKERLSQIIENGVRKFGDAY